MDNCVNCDRRMVPHRHWRRLTPEQRNDLRAENITMADCRGMCQPCYHRSRPGRTPRRPPVPLQVVVEEWTWLAEPHRTDADNIRDLAPRLGMSYSGLEQAVNAARTAGLIQPSRRAA